MSIYLAAHINAQKKIIALSLAGHLPKMISSLKLSVHYWILASSDYV